MNYCANKEGGLGQCSCNSGGLATESTELIPDPNNLDALLPPSEPQEKQEPYPDQTSPEEIEQLQVPQAPEEISYIGDGNSEPGSDPPTEPDTTAGGIDGYVF